MPTNHFLHMILDLRHHEEVILHNDLFATSQQDGEEVKAFLEEEYFNECLDYPGKCPPYNGDAALWAAKITYTASQLLLYRQHKELDLPSLLPKDCFLKDASTILSADLCLRFLPDIIVQLKMIDAEDKLIEILEDILYQWHYSAVKYSFPVTSLDLCDLAPDKCLQQLFADRIIYHKNATLARHPLFKPLVSASLGIHTDEWWKGAKEII